MSSGKVVSGWIEYRLDDIEIVNDILAKCITQTVNSDFPGYRVSRFENAPDEVLASQLKPFWGQFEFLLDN